MIRPQYIFLLTCLVAAPLSSSKAEPATSPNIVIILADDLGFGDVSCYGATRIRTPNIDLLAEQSLRFTDAHSAAAKCTPSRYALLTGEYAWRREGTGILPGDANLIIEPGRATLPAILKKAGFATGAVGKWHLGLGNKAIDWNTDIKPGPLEIGFDYSFIIPATGDRVPCVYVENHRVVGLDPADPITVNYEHPIGNEPTGHEHPELLKMHPSFGHDMAIINGISRIGYMTGGIKALWTDQTIADTLTGKAVEFIEKQASRPFFLYFATHDIHVPRVPHPRFVGKSGLGPRGDVILEFDWSVGQIVAAVDRLHLADNTLLIVSSDNGPVVDDGYKDKAHELLNGHHPAGPLRGGKYSIYEGGTRVPLLVRWPRRVKAGVSDALICQVDLVATCASLVQQQVNAKDAPDSLDMLKSWLGESKQGRSTLVEQANPLGLRQGHWKYIEPHSGPRLNRPEQIELGNDSAPQLYDLRKSLGEQTNLAAEHPDQTNRMAKALEQLKESGRSQH